MAGGGDNGTHLAVDRSTENGTSPFDGLILWNERTTLFTALAGALCYGAASLTFRWVEQPFLARRSRFQ